MKLLIGAAAVLGVAASLAVFLLASGSPNARNSEARDCGPSMSAEPRSVDELRTSRRTQNEIRGSFEHRKTTIEFRSEAEGTEDAGSVTACVEVGRLTIEATRDLDTQAVTSGAGGARIWAKEKEALTAFGTALGPYLFKDRDVRELPPQEDLLLRLAVYYSEAPVGHKLETRSAGPGTSSR